MYAFSDEAKEVMTEVVAFVGRVAQRYPKASIRPQLQVKGKLSSELHVSLLVGMQGYAPATIHLICLRTQEPNVYPINKELGAIRNISEVKEAFENRLDFDLGIVLEGMTQFPGHP